MGMSAFVGIDLGTTFSAVAHITKDGRPEIIKNEYGSPITPSVVYLGAGGPLVGEEAKEKQAAGEEAVASFFKRTMGEPYFELYFEGKSYTSVDLSAEVLKKLKLIAENFLGEPVTHAVVTVPAYFNDIQRKATIEAGQRAGLQVLSIISEPTAAALAFGMRPTQGSQTVLVYDLGGGTFDVSIVQIEPTEQRVIGTGGDHNLGGKDWDDLIFVYLTEKFKDEFGFEPVGDDYNALLVKAENLKKSLSVRDSVDVRIQAGGKTGSYSLSTEQFENLTSNLMERTQRLTEQTLEEVDLTWSQIDQVLLVGGSTRMPMVRKYVQRMSGKPPLTTVNPDEAVALGAAIQAAMDMEALNPQKQVYFLAGRKKSIDVMSHSLGMIAINEDGSKYINSIIIRKNQPIPSIETHPYTFHLSQHKENRLEVFMTQGESTDPIDCTYLGQYVFSNFPLLSTKDAVLDIRYEYDKNGVVQVSASERSTHQPLSLKIEPLPDDVPYRFTLSPQQEATHEHLTIYLAFDISGSMEGDPLREAQKAAHAFIEECDLSTTSIGLICFSETVHLETTASQNAKQISHAIDGMRIGRTGYGTSAQPFDMLYRLFEKVSGKRYSIILTDGLWENQHYAISQAKKCHGGEIEVIAIGFGEADQNFLRQISSSDENSFFTDLKSLTETFSTIAQELIEGRSSADRSPGLRINR
jgi:molecular chaperone DnaK